LTLASTALSANYRGRWFEFSAATTSPLSTFVTH
jgi:hypothetical protein